MGNHAIGRRAFIGSAIAAMSFHALHADSFLDLRHDKRYMWKWPGGMFGSYCTWGTDGESMIRYIMEDMSYVERIGEADRYLDDVASNNLSLAQFHDRFRHADGLRANVFWSRIKGECELEIPVTRDWLIELRRRHMYNRMGIA